MIRMILQGESVSYTPVELMIACAARVLEDGRTVAVGTGVPRAAAKLARVHSAMYLAWP
jgi:acyl CoA:acetate/3-ketoacid CoA transferase beta subunit